MSVVLKSIRDFDLKGQTVFIRVDFNVPIENGKVTDDNRILQALPTIKYAIEQEAKIVLASHLGRPDGKKNPEFSLEPVAARLVELLGDEAEVTLADDCIGEGIVLMSRNLKGGGILLLENLRFHAGEEDNDPKFVHQLRKFAEVYINDAFGTAHRKHASTFGLPEVTEKRGMGFLVEKEVKYLTQVLENPGKPFHVLLGGAKVSDKIKSIETLLRKADCILIGGAMANAFFLAQGPKSVMKLEPGAKKPSAEDIQSAKSILKMAASREIPVLLPVDTIDAFDIGPKTIDLFSEKLTGAKLIFWNGPLGWFEKPQYSHGTFEMARRLGQMGKDTGAIRIVGGGDTVSAIQHSGVPSEAFDHLSTGGGAVLEFIENGGLPGIEVLKYFPKRERRPEFRTR